jgi:hypothetical protein
MPLPFADQGALAVDRGFIAKVRQAAVTLAILKIKADATLTEDQLAARTSFSVRFLQDPQRWSEIMAFGVASRLNDADASDLKITNSLAAIWDNYAGVVA